MRKLIEYAAKADFMNIAIEMDGQKYRFNLDSELKILEAKLNTELKDQTRSYAFLAMLKNKLSVKVKDQEKVIKRKKDKLFIQYKSKTDKVTEATAKANNHKDVLKLTDELDHVIELKNVLDIAVNAFLQRKDLLQTLSSNTRKQNT